MRLVKIFKQRCDQIQRSSSFGKTWRRSAATSSSAGSMMRSSQRHANAASRGRVTNFWRKRSGHAVGQAASTAL